jgi:uncharacterized protein YjbJ (UPF0337 family)
MPILQEISLGTRLPVARFMAHQHVSTMEDLMNWDQVSGNWKQFRGKVKERWGKLTDDELDQIDGNREQLEGKIQEHYGVAKDQVKKQVDEAMNRW